MRGLQVVALSVCPHDSPMRDLVSWTRVLNVPTYLSALIMIRSIECVRHGGRSSAFWYVYVRPLHRLQEPIPSSFGQPGTTPILGLFCLASNQGRYDRHGNFDDDTHAGRRVCCIDALVRTMEDLPAKLRKRSP